MLTQLVIDLNSHLEKPILDHSYLEFWLRIHSKTLPKTDEIDSTNFI